MKTFGDLKVGDSLFVVSMGWNFICDFYERRVISIEYNNFTDIEYFEDDSTHHHHSWNKDVDEHSKWLSLDEDQLNEFCIEENGLYYYTDINELYSFFLELRKKFDENTQKITYTFDKVSKDIQQYIL